MICRSHGIDNVNIDEARKRNIGIISTSPTSKQCAAWIFDKIDDDDGILIFGDGAISKELQTRIKNFNIVNTKTDKADIDRYISECKNIIVTLPSNDTTTHYFNKDLFSKIKNKVTIISISRGEVFDNSALLEFINSDMFIKGHFDMISATGRDDLLKSDNMYYYEHTSWKFNNTNTNSDDIYASELKSIIDQCISGNVNQPQLNRTDVKWF